MKPRGGADLDRFIAGLYRSGLAYLPEDFRTWALRQLQTLIPFDGALWGSGSAENWRFHTVTLLGLPQEFPKALEETVQINPLVAAIMKRADVPVDMESVSPDRVFLRSEIYKRCFRRFGISRILSTSHIETRSGLGSLLSLYRRSLRARFTPAEKAMHRTAVYHLFQAASHSYFLHLMRAFAEERLVGGAAAVVDQHGMYHEAQPHFLDLLDRHFPHRRTHDLPFTPPPPGETHLHHGLCVKTQPLGDLRCVILWPAGPLDRLTARERETVFAVTQGLSFKQAARKIGVAPSTVANHLYRIYRKLGLGSRSELAALVHPPE